jgi:phosphonate transport system permease protein
LKSLKLRLLALLLDWGIWGYVAYCVFYLINHWYRELLPVSPVYKVPFPPYGWIVTIAATLGLAVLWESFGQSLGSKLMGLSAEEAGEGPRRRWFKTSWGWMAVILIILTVYVGGLITEVDLRNLAQRASKTTYLWKWLFTPDFAHFTAEEPVLQDSIASALIETIFMALMATAFGIIFAFPLSFLGARNIMATGPFGWAIYTVTRGVFNIIRSIEPIILAVIFAVWIKFGPFAGALALTFHTIAALGKLFSEQVEGIDPGPLEAITATGARRWQVILYGVIPQIVPPYLAFTLYRWDINVRMSTIIGLVGGGGIGRLLFYFKNEIRWREVGAVIMVIVAVVWLMDYLSARVRERIV